jgi:hypothetical protein
MECVYARFVEGYFLKLIPPSCASFILYIIHLAIDTLLQENTRNEDQPVPASTRMKGVEFPFAVGDRVMIKVTTFVVLCIVTQVYASE